ncbi:extracellular solute-binding protein [Tabrizicola sp.]|uniref:extracellular solute-binding protein n=1 Tax=Tabrizicola sp. TaxID=2005166 RepID=UPI0025E01074|nr:extracellular solute-binding protein [Tabrizicola sp.]
MTQRLAAAALVLAATAGSASAEKIKFEYWYGLTGDLGAVVAETCNRFNASQDQFEAVCVGQDGYEKAVQNTIAAFRAGKHPTLLQSFDAGTADLMLSGEFYPVTQLMADTGVTVDWTDYFPGIANYYSSKSGEFFSMPWNSSTPVYYFNKDHFAKAGITEAPVTWEGMEEAFKALKASGQACSLAYAPSSWIDLEQFSMAHNIPVASNNNGYDGLDTELLFNTTLHVQHMENIQRWITEGYALLRTQAAGKTSRDSFVEGECSVFFSSIADHNTIHKLTPAFGWDVQIIPTYEGVERHNTVVGGASLWVLAGKTEDEYKAAASYLAFLATKPEQQFLLENTGYIPVTKSTYEALLAEGFYAKAPYLNRDIAMKSLTYTEPTELTRGIRLGGMIQIRSEWQSEVEAALAGQKTMKEALDNAVSRGNDQLTRFAQTYAGKSFP